MEFGGNSRSRGIQFVKSSENEDRPPSSNSSNTGSSTNGSQEAKSGPHRFSGASNQFSSFRERGPPTQSFVRPGGGYKSSSNGKNAWRDNSSPASGSLAKQQTFPRTPPAKFVVTPQQYQNLWRGEKDPDLVKIRKLAWEVASLKSDRPNAIDKLHSASNRVPVQVEFNTEPVLANRGNNFFMCHVFVEGILVGSGQGVKIKDSKVNAYEAALQKILMPELRVNRLDSESRELEGSKEPFTCPPPEPSTKVLPKRYAQLPPSGPKGTKEHHSQHKESNLEAASVKRRIEDQRPIEDFVIVEPLVPIPDCTPAHTVRRSADFNHMLLEYEYFFSGEYVRCVMSVEGQMLADVNAGSKLAAKNKAAEQGLRKLKQICWVIKTKQAVDSDTKICKEEMLSELTDQSDKLSDDNVGNKMLRKMGWSGGGVGKDGSGIAEPVSLKSVLNREGLGLGAEKGITHEYRRRVKEVIENYAASGNQEDLVFNYDFRLEERLIIHDECRRLNLRSKCKGKGTSRYLCVRRKRSANMLFDHIMSCGGETFRYKLVPPGEDAGQSYLPRKSGSGASHYDDKSTVRQESDGHDGKMYSSSLQGASSMNPSNDPSPPQKMRRELNYGSDSRNKQETKWEFAPPPQFLGSYPGDASAKRNIPLHGNMQNGFQNSSSNFSVSSERNSCNTNNSLSNSQSIGNPALRRGDVSRAVNEPNSSPFADNVRNNEGYHVDYHPNGSQNYSSDWLNYDSRNRLGPYGNLTGSPGDEQGLRMGSSNHFLMPSNGRGFSNQCRNGQVYPLHNACNFMNPGMGAPREQWPGEGAITPQQSQMILQTAVQNFNQTAAQWMAAQQEANNSNMGLSSRPRFGRGRGGTGT